MINHAIAVDLQTIPLPQIPFVNYDGFAQMAAVDGSPAAGAKGALYVAAPSDNVTSPSAPGQHYAFSVWQIPASGSPVKHVLNLTGTPIVEGSSAAFDSKLRRFWFVLGTSSYISSRQLYAVDVSGASGSWL